MAFTLQIRQKKLFGKTVLDIPSLAQAYDKSRSGKFGRETTLKGKVGMSGAAGEKQEAEKRYFLC